MCLAGTGLCLGFSMRIMLITYWCFGCCQTVHNLNQGLFSVSYSSSKEMHKSLGGSWPGEMTETGWRAVWCCRMPCPVCNMGELLRRVADDSLYCVSPGLFWVLSFSLSLSMIISNKNNFYFVSIVKLFLTHTFLLFSWFSLQSHYGWGKCDQLCGI